MALLSQAQLEDLAEDKAKQLKDFIECQPPLKNGEDLLQLWEKLYDEEMKAIVVKTVSGPSDDQTNLVFPYEKLQAVIGDGGNWKWPRMWQRFDEIERRGTAFREGERLNFGMPNKNPNITPQRVLVVGGGPIGLRLAIELRMGGHLVTVFEKRREIRDDSGNLQQLGFTNRINRPHMWPFVRNDLLKLNGKDFMSREACYPVFTEPETSSIGIDELQSLLLKNVLMLGVDFRLGVGYENAKIRTDPRTMRPTWEVDCTYDEHAAEYFNMQKGRNKQVFDCLIGCDGPRSNVRDTQSKYFGNIEKRKFMDCVGIVANVRKVGRKRLKELGFEYGQEPGDMNRTKMVFKDFFNTIAKEADAEIESLIYYKASHHNYVILVPKRADLVKHGLSGKVYHFAKGRDKAAEEHEEKAKLKAYCSRVLKAARIPIDEKAENGGFVDAPNDCMAFDFAECWNTKKSIVFNMPPPDYDVEQHGPWMGRNVVPLVGLCGDALLEPFWPMGLGLKRGWQAIMDTCYAVDNLYNRTLFCERASKDPDSFTWEEHYEMLKEQVASNFEMCSRLKVAEELGKGEYAEKGPVITQLKKINKDAEKPMLLVEIDPWTRYAPLEKERGDEWKLKMNDERYLHPKVQKALAMKEYYDEVSKGGKNGEIEYEGKKLISVNGKVVGGFGKAGTTTRRDSSLGQSGGAAATGAAPKPPAGAKFGVNPFAGVVTKETLLEAKGAAAAAPSPSGGLAGIASGVASACVARPVPPAPSVSPPAVPAPGRSPTLSCAQEAELAHVRHMIQSLTQSLEQYKKAETELVGGKA
mmetsp:Transcript_19189/g.55705  ORF Transcript_19189/g.55705 Transcript_19189/m.55705 type:complete len:807 (+) Transcript_19189:42-2462(+)